LPVVLCRKIQTFALAQAIDLLVETRREEYHYVLHLWVWSSC